MAAACKDHSVTLWDAHNGKLKRALPELASEGFSVAFSLATAIFGGFTPAICTYLIERTGNRAVPGMWLSFAALLGLVAVVQLGRRPVRAPVAAPATS